jgi:hypothetical protein
MSSLISRFYGDSDCDSDVDSDSASDSNSNRVRDTNECGLPREI